MREPGIPKNWSMGKFARGDHSRLPNAATSPAGSQLPHNSSAESGEVSAQPALKLQSLTPNRCLDKRPLPPNTAPKKPPKWLTNWAMWWGVAGLISSSVGVVAIAMLLKLPAAPNCPAIFWPLATATVRMHCAEVAANKQTVKDLLEAISLVEALPKNHPLRAEINKSIQQWTIDILDLGDRAFQAGKLPSAIAIAKKIPRNVPAYQVVEQRIASWESVWKKAEDTYSQAEAQLPKRNWHEAFMAAVGLLNVGNDYWETTKYDQLNRLIETAKEDANSFDKAKDLGARGGISNLLEAIKLAQEIGTSSYSYKDAQALIPELGKEMLDLAQNALDRKDAEEAISIANQIPPIANLQLEAKDFITIAEAWRSAWLDNVPGLEGAIAIAQKVSQDRPLYNKAQELIARWQLEIEDVAHLQRARELAKGGTVGDLTAAIAQAEVVPENNPRAIEAKGEVNRWRTKVETIEDRPYLNRAEELASGEDVGSLQAAINEASQISKGRSLYSEARRKIRDWRQLIEQVEDRPLLEEARSLASRGNLPLAIETAGQIKTGRSLSSEARSAINDWEGQINARVNWQQARQIAVQGTPEALVRAIRVANRIPNSSPLRYDANLTIAEWSNRILSIAQDRGQSDIPGAIEVAKLVPLGTEAYPGAQDQIATWERFLNPPKPAPEPEAN
ncbi:chromosome segregation ATPase [Chlorogloea sp. CCALA 695]|uniref:chromosome segregation ATPase n=1 Tax=Chlorogloea sp. CCALA 695 TaxID=2107693 RepID=UPI000D04E54C|nr:chromosome segregation ATPase [Chlorogloea sp. CCALA 695]PSB31570.1 chromosome segregation ATPase [Chlorogloea sp. CCALA 695]